MKYILIIVILFFENSFCQTYNTKIETLIVKKAAKNSPIDKILLLNKFIDTTLPVRIKVGGISTTIKADLLKDSYSIITGKNGKAAFIAINNDGQDIVSLKLYKGKLLINAEIYDFDGKIIATVDNNKLSSAANVFKTNATDAYFEVIDEYNIPVLQIKLIKKTNTIQIAGAFNTSDAWTLFGINGSLTFHPLWKPKYKFTLVQKDSIFQIYKTDTKSLVSFSKIVDTPKPFEMKENFISEKTIVPDVSPVFNTKTSNINFPKIHGIHTEFSKNKVIYVEIGDMAVVLTREDLCKGVDIFKINGLNSVNAKLILGMNPKDNRLYASLELKNLEKEEIIGFMHYNNWKNFKNQLITYNESDSAIEINDKQKNIVFSMKFKQAESAVIIKGFFIDDKSILIFNHGSQEGELNLKCIKKTEIDWKRKAALAVSKILSEMQNKPLNAN